MHHVVSQETSLFMTMPSQLVHQPIYKGPHHFPKALHLKDTAITEDGFELLLAQ